MGIFSGPEKDFPVTSGKEHFWQIRQGSPEEIARNFRWDTSVFEKSSLEKDFEYFYRRYPHFPLGRPTLSKILEESFGLIDQVWETLSLPLPYHNSDHAKNTGVIGLELAMGGVESSFLAAGFPNFDKIMRIFSFFGFLHEIDDWWNLPSLKDAGGQERMEKAKQLIGQYLGLHGLSPYDFDRFLRLDNFSESPAAALEKARTLAPTEGFLGMATSGEHFSFIDELPTEERDYLWQIFSRSINAADFLQVVNLAYLQPAEVSLAEGGKHLTCCGQVVLAEEMNRWRPKALANLGWQAEGGKVNWEKVIPAASFIEDVALPRITPALPYLDCFSPKKRRETEILIERLRGSIRA